MVPLGNAHVATSVRRTDQTEEQSQSVFVHNISPKYFSVLEIPLKAGRTFSGDPAERGVIINEALARLLWPGESAVGRTLESSGPREVIGVIADVRTDQLDRVEPTLFEPSHGFANVLLRDDPGNVAHLKAIVTGIEPRAAFIEEELADNLREQLHPASVAATLVALMGGLALLLSAVGTFGVFSYVVGERTREIGVRVALGGTASNIVAALLRQVSWPLLGGLGAGLVASLLLSPVIAGELYGVSPRDPLAYAAVTVMLGLSAVLATAIPARRALRVDPVITLRAE
jgi:ABC-type antimicrobial peptide transport system permease subunit